MPKKPTTAELFDNHLDQFGYFDRIPIHERCDVQSADLCGILYLNSRLTRPKDPLLLVRAEFFRPRVYLTMKPAKHMKEEDVIYALRCGINYDEKKDLLFFEPRG